MTRRRTTRVSTKIAACVAVLALAAFGCTTTSEEEDSSATDSEFVQGDQDEVEKVVVEEVEGVTVVEDVAVDLGAVYFDFDRSNIRSDARPVLRGNADRLRRAGIAVRLEGHTDERGDEEYNLALGERRANATKQYLENLGVDNVKMRTISYGEAKPAVAGHTEEAWRYNRRVEFAARR